MLNYINHTMPIYKDCTFFEMLMVCMAYLIVVGNCLALLTWIVLGHAIIGYIIALACMLHTVRFLLGRLQKLKYGKPYGYYRHLFLKKIVGITWMQMMWKSPWVLREGRWSVRRLPHE